MEKIDRAKAAKTLRDCQTLQSLYWDAISDLAHILGDCELFDDLDDMLLDDWKIETLIEKLALE